MSFKDRVNRDRDIFINISEFGEKHNINGRAVECIVDDQTNRERQGGTEFAVAQSTILLYAKNDDLPPRREPGEELRFDGVPYTIVTWDEDMGISTIALFIGTNV